MEIPKRCQSCGYYPFCKNIPTIDCKKWKKRKVQEMKDEFKQEG